MKVLFVGYGWRGDVQPMLALALRAQREGYEAVVAATPDFGDFVRRFGLEFRPIGLDAQGLVQQSPGIGTRGLAHLWARFTLGFRAHLRTQFVTLDAACHDIDTLVASGGAVAASSVAERRGLRYCYVAYCPAVIVSSEHAPVLSPWPKLSPWMNRRLWSVFLFAFRISVGRVLSNLRQEMGLPRLADAYRHMIGERVILAADPALAPVPEDCASKVVHSSHEELSDPAPLDPRIERFLADGERPIFIGFGSMVDDNPTRTTRIIVEAVGGRRTIVARGWAGLGKGIDDRRILVIDEAPHATLFARVAGVVHHGGAGTTHTAARAGVPQIVVPHLLDQFYWGARVHALGLRPKPIARKQLDVARLSDALAHLDEHSEAAKRFAGAMGHAPPLRKLFAELGL